MWRQVVSQTPRESTKIDSDHPYAKAASQLNELIRSGRSLSGHERNCMFLNMGGKQFATASSIGGFDFEDDGRAIAECDWDFDGDIDLWVANRTAPQIRYLENEVGSRKSFVAFRLRGTKSNRDGIGARIELETDPSLGVLMQGLRAGEGFLAQSSKVVHFGLGDAKQITRLVVHWPNGDAETFPAPELNGYYSLVEGAGRVERWFPPPAKARRGTVQSPHTPSESMATTNPLVLPFPLPPLQYRATNDQVVDATKTSEQLTVINLWASWCEPCLKELAEWQQHRSLFGERGIQVLALSVEAERKNVGTTLPDRGITFDAGVATEGTLEVIQMVHDAIYDHHKRIPVPTSLLLNGNGQLVAIIKGNASAKQVCAAFDRTADVDPDSRLPFRGRWVGTLGDYKLASFAADLWDAGFLNESMSLVDRVDPIASQSEAIKARLSLSHRLKLAKRIQESMEQLQAAYKLAPQDADVNLKIGELQAEYGKLPLAIGHFMIAIENSASPRSDLHAALGISLRRMNEVADAEKHLKRAIELDPQSAFALHGLGLLQATQSRTKEGIANLAKAVTIEPSKSSYRINYATALSQSERYDEALKQLEIILAAEPDSLSARIYKGEVYAASGRNDQAIKEFSHVVQRSPKASRVWLRLGEVQEDAGRLRGALSSFQTVASLTPNDSRPNVKIAWILATAPDDDLRDPAKALVLAKSAVDQTQGKDPIALDVMAAALADNQQFANAVKTCDKVLSLIDLRRDASFHAAVVTRRAQYVDKKPFRSARVNEE